MVNIFWPDIFLGGRISFAVIALHTAYIAALLTGARSPVGLMVLALSAYASYAINATQFIYKLRMARLDAAVQAWMRRSPLPAAPPRPS